MNVALYVPGVEEANEQITVEVPSEARVTLVGHDRERAAGDATLRFMLPAKPARLENVRPSTSEEPALKAIDEGPAILKSVMFTASLTELLSEPLVPVIVRAKAPAGRPAPQVGNSLANPPAGTKIVEVLVNVVNQHAKAVEEGLATSITLPEKPLRLVTVTVVCRSEATGIEMKVALSVMVKSPEEVELVTVTVMVTVCEIEPAEPVTATEYDPTGVVDKVDTDSSEVPVPPDESTTLV